MDPSASAKPVPNPELPAVPDYPSDGPDRFKEKLLEAKQFVTEQLDTQEGWEDIGQKNDVSYYRKLDPEDYWGVPYVKGSTVVNSTTTDELVGVLILEGMRKVWDARFELGHLVSRYNHDLFTFYSVMKGFGWLVWPRDIFGVQGIFRDPEREYNKEILIIQTSVEDKDIAPDQGGKVRAALKAAGWRLRPKEDGVLVEYFVKISLEGSIPSSVVSTLVTEIPACCGTARDCFDNYGHPPYVRPLDGEKQIQVICQTETITSPNPRSSLSREWHLIFTPPASISSTFPSTSPAFEIVYDEKRMYTSESLEVLVTVEGEGDDEIEIEDDGEGRLVIRCGEKTRGRRCDVWLKPKECD